MESKLKKEKEQWLVYISKNITRISVWVGFFLLLLFLTGCNGKHLNSGTNAESIKNNPKLDSDEPIKFEESGLVVDIPAHEAYNFNQKKYQVKSILLNLNKIKEVVFPEDISKITIDRPGKDGEELTTEDGLMIYQEDNGSLITGNTEAFYIYNEILDFTEDNTLTTSTDGELAFMSKESVQKEIKEIIKKLDFSFESGEMYIKAYTNKHFWESIEYYKENPDFADFVSEESFQRDWDIVDEVYYVQVNFQKDGIPIDPEGYSLLDESQIYGMQMEFLLTKEGIQSFTFYSPLEKVEEVSIKIYSIQDMLSGIVEKYDNIITDSKPSIINAVMEYNILPEASNGDLYLVPVVRFETKEVLEMHSAESEEAQMQTIYDVIRVNAETGRIIE